MEELNILEVSNILKLSYKQIYRLILSEELKAIKINNRIRISQSEINKYIKELK